MLALALAPLNSVKTADTRYFTVWRCQLKTRKPLKCLLLLLDLFLSKLFQLLKKKNQFCHQNYLHGTPPNKSAASVFFDL